MEERFKFRRVNEITGAFVLAVIAVLIASVVWASHSQRWFKSRVPLQITLPEAGAAGIREGSEVYFLGTLVGSVSDVIVEPTGRMEAEAYIRRDFFRFVRVDSSAVVKKKLGVAGDSFFEITRGEGRPLPEQNASIPCTEQYQSALESAIEEVHQEAMLVLKKAGAGVDTWAKLGTDLGETRQRLDEIALRLDNMVSGIEAGKGAAGKFIADPLMADEAQKLLERTDETLSEFQNVATNLNLTVKDIQASAARLPGIADAAANEAKDLPGLVLQTRNSMVELQRLVEALQREWLIRKYVNHTNPPPVDPFSETAAPEKKPSKNPRSPKNSAN